MSATNELLHEEIELLRIQLKSADGQEKLEIESRLHALVERFERGLNALNEGKTVLKG